MIQTFKQTDEKLHAAQAAAKPTEEGAVPGECWLLHGAVGSVSDWRALGKGLAEGGFATRAVDLWRFLQCESVPMPEFGRRLNAEAAGEVSRGGRRGALRRVLVGYSMGGRLALHALLEQGPWDAAVLISTNPGLRDPREISRRRTTDTRWAAEALTSPWAEFLEKWSTQPILHGAIRDEREDAKLVQRRREIARSFVDWSLGNQESLWDKLPAIRIPTLWIAGEKDGKFRALAEEACSLTGGADLAIAPGAGHRVPWENQPWLLGEMEKLLARVSS